MRYLTNDIPEQADQVEQLLQRAQNGEIQLMTTSMVIAEIVWTLSSFYKLSREQIRDRILAILNTPGLTVSEAGLLIEADYYRQGHIGASEVRQILNFSSRWETYEFLKREKALSALY